MDLLIASAIFAIIFVFALVLITGSKSGTDQNKEISRRLTRPTEDADPGIMRKRRPDEGKMLAVLYRVNLLRHLEEMMWQAGMYMRVGDILLIIVLLFGGGMFLGDVMFGDMLFGVGTGLLLAAMPLVYIQFRTQAPLKGVQRAVAVRARPDQILARSGPFAPARACRSWSASLPIRSASSFAPCSSRRRIGLPLPRALDDMLKRVPEDDLRLLMVAVKVQSEVGSVAGANRRAAV